MDPITILSILGALAGLGGGLKSLFSSNKPQQNQASQFGLPQGSLQIPKYGPEGMQALNQLLGMGLSGLQQNAPSFGPIAQNARRDFATQTVPLLAERFGGLGARRSGAFEGVLSGANRQFEQDLRAQEQQFGQQNRNQLLQMLQLGLTSPYESIYKTRQPGFGENLAVAAVPSLIQNAPQLYNLLQGTPAEGAK